MKTLGPQTKAAIKRIVDNLPHLRSEGSAVPTGARDSLSQIKAKYAADHARTDGDPLTFAAQAWVEEQLGEALENDDKASASKTGTGDEAKGEDHKPAAKKADEKDADSDTHKTKAKH